MALVTYTYIHYFDITMNGIHGTTVEISKKIRNTGFQVSSTGRAGPGVYFWRYFNNDEYAKYLAFKWWEYSEKVGNYNAVGGDMRCCYVSVKLNTDNFNYIDISHGVMREIIRDLIRSKIDEVKNNAKKASTEEEIISSLFTTFVKQIESNEDLLVDAIITDVPPPKGATGVVGKYIGSCAEAIVLLNLDMIEQIDYAEES